MTTIVYDHARGQIACDSRLTKDETIITDSGIKYIETSKGMLFLAGSVSDFELLASIVESNDHGDSIESRSDIYVEAFLVINGKVQCVSVIDGAMNYDKCAFNLAIGCGSNWALSSVDHGKTAKQAVQYAATRDIYTGGKVHVYDIKKGKFING